MSVDLGKLSAQDLKKVALAAKSSEGDKVLKQIKAAQQGADDLKKQDKILDSIVKANPDV
jgi:hypothetical protein